MQKIVLFNATTIVKGGGIQAAVTIIRFIFSRNCFIKDLSWIFAVSPAVRDELASFDIQLRTNKDICIEKTPAKNRISRKVLYDFADYNADLIFTFFGPSYVTFSKPHLCGVADGWVTHSTALAFSTLPSTYKKLHMFAVCCYKAFWLRTANAWVVEQDVAKRGLIQRLRLPAKHIHVVENNHGQAYQEIPISSEAKPLQPRIRILTFAAYYPNKGLELVPSVIQHLIKNHNISNVCAVLTIPPNIYQHSRISTIAAQLNVMDHIENIGSVPLTDGPALYNHCDILFFPSVLETFSATYPESMRMSVPIVTSDLPFARNICNKAALYFKPLSARDAADKLAALISSAEIRNQLVSEGHKRLAKLPSPEQRYSKYADILISM